MKMTLNEDGWSDRFDLYFDGLKEIDNYITSEYKIENFYSKKKINFI